MAVAQVGSPVVGWDQVSGTTATSAAKSTTTGNLLYLSARWEGGAAGLVVTDTAGNTWHPLTQKVHSGNSDLCVQGFWAENITGNASNVVLVTFDAARIWKGGIVSEWNGVGNGQTPVESTAQVSATSSISTSITSSGAGVVFTTCATYSTQSVHTATGTGFTLNVSNGPGVNQYVESQTYKTPIVGATETPGLSWGSGDDAVMTAAFFAVATSGPTISVQPQDQYVNEGATATFSVTGASSGGTLTYQWKKFNGTIFVNATGGTGATTSSYSPPAAAFSDSGSVYRCALSDDNGSTNSNIATLRVAFKTTGTGPRITPVRLVGGYYQGTYTPSSGNNASISYSEAAEAVASTAQVSVQGSVSYSEATEAVSAATLVAVAASAGYQEAAENAATSVGVAVQSGVSYTEATESVASTAAVNVAASISYSEATENVSITIGAISVGSVAYTEAAENVSVSVTNLVTTNTAYSEATEAVASSTAVAVLGALGYQEAPEGVSTAVAVIVAASTAFTEAVETVSIAAVHTPITGGVAYTEAVEAVSSAVSVVISAATSYTEATENAGISATVAVGANSAIQEDADSFQSTAAVLVQAVVGWTEAVESVRATAQTVTDASLLYKDRSSDYTNGTLVYTDRSTSY
jgi:hypothetical protein